MSLYQNKRQEMTKIFEKVQFVSFTTDIWTSPSSMPFMCIAAHFVFEFRMYNSVISFTECPESHTGQNIRSRFEDTLKEFGLEGKLFCVTTDNASNNEAFLASLAGFDVDNHIRCLSHVINLCTQSFLLSAEPFVSKVRDCVKKLRSSHKNLNSLERICQNSKVSYLKPCLDCKTRWNSTLHMLKVFLQMRRPISALMAEIALDSVENPPRFFAAEIECLQFIESFLESFANATDLVGGTYYPTLSMVVPVYNILWDHCEEALR